MSLPAQNRVRSTCVHSTQALVIVGRESNQKLPHLTMVRAITHYPLMKNSTTLWHLFTSWVPRCQNSHLFTPSQHSVGYEIYLPTNSIGSDSKEARRGYVAIPWQKGGDDDRGSTMKGGVLSKLAMFNILLAYLRSYVMWSFFFFLLILFCTHVAFVSF